MKKILFILIVIWAATSAQAITLSEFIAKCDTICPSPAIMLTSDSVPELQQEKVDRIIVYRIDSSAIETVKPSVLNASNLITQTDNMLVVKHCDDAEVQVFIQPQDENVELLVTMFDEKESVVVYLAGSSELLKKDNIVNIGGKDLVKEALRNQEQQE